MAKRRTGVRRVPQKGQRADTQGRPGGAGIGASVVPELLVGAVNGVEVLANGVLKLFGPLQVVRYEIATGKSDFFNRSEMEILRLVVRKPGA